MIRITASAFAEANNISREAGASMMQYLRQAGLLTNVGTVAKGEGQRGRGETLYEGDEAQISAHLHTLKLP